MNLQGALQSIKIMGGDLAPKLGDHKIFSRPNFRKSFHFQG